MWIIFVGGHYGRELQLIQVDGSGRTTLYSRNTRVSHPEFLLNGSSIVFLEEPEGRGVGSIRIVSQDGHSVRSLTNTR
jgi:hypothetical protein